MYQIDVPSAAAAIPASTVLGVPGFFTDGDLVAGVEPTILPAEFLNALMLEVLNVVTGAGIVPSKAAPNQMLLAIETLIEARAGEYAVDTGIANAYVIALNPAIAAYAPGLTVRFRVAHANTGPSTLNAGAGPAALLRDDGAPLVQGDVVPGIAVATFDGVTGGFLINSIVPSQLGALAKEGIGQGLEDDGTGNLRVKLADNSLRRTPAGIQVNEPVSYFSGPVVVGAANHGANFVSTANATLTVAQTTSLWNGFVFAVSANVGSVTVQPNAADGINGGTAGAAYLVPNKTSAVFMGDGNGNIVVLYQTSTPGSSPAPQYINASQSVPSGQYAVDTSAGPVALVLPASPANGTSVRVIDAFNTFAINNLALIAGGTNTIYNSGANFICDMSGADVLFVYKNGNWSPQ